MAGRVAIVGAGVVGACCAYELALAGWEVDLIDRGPVGGGCSHGNCGYIAPSHVFPLAKPGALAATLPLLFRRNSPFRIKPRPDPALLAWLWRFTTHCNAADAQRASVALHGLLAISKRRCEEIIAAESLDAGYEDRGCLFVYTHPEHLDAFAPANDAIRARFGYAGERLTGDALARFEPALRDGLAGAWYFPCDAHLRSDRFMASLAAALARRGVRIHENRVVTGAVHDRGRLTSLRTSQGDIAADTFVFAPGAWTPLLRDALGVRLPIQPGKGYSVTTARPDPCPAYPMIFEEDRVAVTPFADGYRIGSMMEFAGYDTTLDPRRIDLLKSTAARYLRGPTPPGPEERWWGWRPMTPDGLPFIGPVPGKPNVLVAAGHNMIGMSTGPGTGVLIAQAVTGQAPAIDPHPFRVGR